jgi:type II secretory pathway component PulM
MTSFSPSPVTKKNRLQSVKRLPPKLAIGVGVCLFMGVLWFLMIQPLQQTLELRLQKYPTQLLSIQELNRTLLTYKDKTVKITSLSENDISVLQQKLFSQGVKFTLVRLENAGIGIQVAFVRINDIIHRACRANPDPLCCVNNNS